MRLRLRVDDLDKVLDWFKGILRLNEADSSKALGHSSSLSCGLGCPYLEGIYASLSDARMVCERFSQVSLSSKVPRELPT